MTTTTREDLVSILLKGKTSISDTEQWQNWLANIIPKAVANLNEEEIYMWLLSTQIIFFSTR